LGQFIARNRTWAQQRFAQSLNAYQARPASSSVKHNPENEKQTAALEKSSPQFNPTVLLSVVARSKFPDPKPHQRTSPAAFKLPSIPAHHPPALLQPIALLLPASL
jgi:hypothetical protein